MTGRQLLELLVGQTMANACLLDFLVENQHLIPESWKLNAQDESPKICFWGTIFQNGIGRGARYLYWNEEWLTGFRYLNDQVDARDATAIFKS